MRHLRKSRGGSAIYQGQGSIDITAACRSVLMVGMGHDQPVMAHAKCNLAKLGPSLAYSIKNGRFKWGGQVSTTAEDLAAEPDSPEKRAALDVAVEFLREALSQGRVASQDLRKQAKELGIADRTLARAKKKVGAKAKQDGGHWCMWCVYCHVYAYWREPALT